MIQLKNISKIYSNKNTSMTILHPTYLTINDGEILGIVGKSGAGKSTLIRIINGLIRPTTGDVFVDGVSMFSLKQKDINRMRHSIGMIFQHFNLLHSMNAYDNIKLALTIGYYRKEDINDRIYELLGLVGLTGKESRYPSQLSGGEKQRLGIARALANRPKYLLCDEATSALDQETANEIIQLLKDIQHKTQVTIVFISHQMDVIKDLCTRVIIMDNGEIIEDQPIKAMFTHPVHPKTKVLVHSLTYEKPNDVIAYELIYDQKNSGEAILSNMIKTYHVDVNILFAKTLKIQEEWIGYLYVEIHGDDLKKAIQYLKDQRIEVSLYA
jgi:D-methionine transport system ATP-binding protein